jgi:hypothetical protein
MKIRPKGPGERRGRAHGVLIDQRGQEQPVDRLRAPQVLQGPEAPQLPRGRAKNNAGAPGEPPTPRRATFLVTCSEWGLSRGREGGPPRAPTPSGASRASSANSEGLAQP